MNKGKCLFWEVRSIAEWEVNVSKYINSAFYIRFIRFGEKKTGKVVSVLCLWYTFTLKHAGPSPSYCRRIRQRLSERLRNCNR